jgi:hypothetical protein
MSPESATKNIIELVTAGMGWIDPDYAIEMFMDMTGLKGDAFEVDDMLSILSDRDLLYYEDDSTSDNKGERVEFGKISMKELPHRAPEDLARMEPPVRESRIKRFDEFN